MAEFTYASNQEVAAGQNVLLDTTIGCTRGFVLHRDGSGLVSLRGPVNGGCNRFARYQCTFNGNIAVPTGGTAGEISLSLALDGEPLQASKAISTPTVVDAYFNVTSTAIIDVPVGCCPIVAIENTSDQAINVQNANFVVTRIA